MTKMSLRNRGILFCFKSILYTYTHSHAFFSQKIARLEEEENRIKTIVAEAVKQIGFSGQTLQSYMENEKFSEKKKDFFVFVFVKEKINKVLP